MHTLEQSHSFVLPDEKAVQRNYMADTVQMMKYDRKRECRNNSIIPAQKSRVMSSKFILAISIIQNAVTTYSFDLKNKAYIVSLGQALTNNSINIYIFGTECCITYLVKALS